MPNYTQKNYLKIFCEAMAAYYIVCQNEINKKF